MPSAARRLINWAAAFEDGAIIRAAFFGLLTATAVILYLDYTDMMARQPATGSAPDLQPILPAFDPTAYLESHFVNEDEAPLLPATWRCIATAIMSAGDRSISSRPATDWISASAPTIASR